MMARLMYICLILFTLFLPSSSFNDYNLTVSVSSTNFYCPSPSTIKIGYLTNINGKNNIQKQGLIVSGALSYAIDKINADSRLLDGVKLEFIYNDTLGEPLKSTKAMLEQWEHGVAVFFGPENYCEVEATIAAAINLPIISYKCEDPKVLRREFYSTFARTSPPNTQIIQSIVTLFAYYKWLKFSIIYENKPEYQILVSRLTRKAISEGFTINSEKRFENFYTCCEKKKPCCLNPFSAIIEDTYRSTRVWLFFGDIRDLRKMLLVLRVRNLLQNGEYIVIYIDFETYSVAQSYRYTWNPGMSIDDARASLEAARSLLVIVPSPPRGRVYSDFEDKVREYNTFMPFNFTRPFRAFKKHITIYASYLYDAVMLYAEALSSVLSDGLCHKNGQEIMKRIISKKRYQSVTGAWMSIDEYGDVVGNYTVLSLLELDPNVKLKGTDAFKKLGYSMLPVGGFDYDETTNETVFRLDRAIYWVGGRPPFDEPPCGFDGRACNAPKDNTREILVGILAGMFVTTSIIAVIAYRNWKYEQEIAGLLWKIPLGELKLCDERVPLSLSKMSLASGYSFESKAFHARLTKTATYRGKIVSIKTLQFNKRSVELTREIKIEMKLMKEIHHDHINPFIGAYIEPNRVYIVTEYCAKGSLEDILANRNVKLDCMFVASLIFDLISAMIYLHESDIKVHGNLKSSNCLITSRWVLHVTDFGLHQLRKSADINSIDSHDYYERLLWTSPELLRTPQIKGTQKGDTYAFGIILHEIMAREGPFNLHSDENKLTCKQVVEKVRDDYILTGLHFRPDMYSFECQDYIINVMKDCWAECPESRPDFRMVRVRLKRMRQGLKADIVDNMMEMMEKYANNLEELVDDRTAQLAEEKKKTESLLHQMLPKSVASQLMRGECVVPEIFDAVTIFFSDIVGFTAMSAESTPMEIVTFLNDLYTLFDDIINHYDVYKVETIGDAYMVVSGLPFRNSDKHASEIASMALELLDSVKSFEIRHKKSQTLQLRIGIHTGKLNQFNHYIYFLN